MPRQSPAVTQQEVQDSAKWASDNNFVWGATADGIANANFIHAYFMKWNEVISEANLNLALEQLRPHLKTYQPYEKEFSDLWAGMSETERNTFKSWKGVVGLKDNMRNACAILGYCRAHGWEITKDHLQLASSQSVVAPHLEWDYISQHKETQHSKTDDGKGFLSGNTPVNEPMYLKLRREREERERRNNTAPVVDTESAARQQALDVQGNTHSESEQIGKIFVTEGTQISWSKTLQARLQMQQAFNRHRQTSRFIR